MDEHGNLQLCAFFKQRIEDRIVGVFYTATRDVAAPYTPLLRQRMELLCRAGSLATILVSTGGVAAFEEAAKSNPSNIPGKCAFIRRSLKFTKVPDSYPPKSLSCACL